MARIAGVDLPKNKRGVIGLTYIFGIGRSRAEEILAKAKIEVHTKVKDWNDDNIRDISGMIQNDYTVHVPEKVKRRLLLTRKKLLSNG